MKRYLLDTSALLTLRDDEPGAQHVADILRMGQNKQAHCFGCFISLMEVLYRVWRDEGENQGKLAYEQCLVLPMEWIHESSDLLRKAAEIKATQSLSLADAWIAASGVLQGAVLVHKDPEFKALDMEQEILPLKGKSSST
ncbi:MAG: PIN domain-containing protein [Desulfonatronovibrio sp.]